jgi:hypothetical protein
MSSDNFFGAGGQQDKTDDINQNYAFDEETVEDQASSLEADQAPVAAVSPLLSPIIITTPTSSKTQHHLLKHQLPEKDVSQHFGTSDRKIIGKMISKMGQRELQASFRLSPFARCAYVLVEQATKHIILVNRLRCGGTGPHYFPACYTQLSA